MFQKEKAKVPRFRYTPLKGFGVMAPGLEPPDSDSVCSHFLCVQSGRDRTEERLLLFSEVSHPSVGLNQFCSKVGKCISKAGRKHGGSLESELLSPAWCMAQMGRRCPRPRHPELYHCLPDWMLPWPPARGPA